MPEKCNSRDNEMCNRIVFLFESRVVSIAATIANTSGNGMLRSKSFVPMISQLHRPHDKCGCIRTNNKNSNWKYTSMRNFGVYVSVYRANPPTGRTACNMLCTRRRHSTMHSRRNCANFSISKHNTIRTINCYTLNCKSQKSGWILFSMLRTSVRNFRSARTIYNKIVNKSFPMMLNCPTSLMAERIVWIVGKRKNDVRSCYFCANRYIWTCVQYVDDDVSGILFNFLSDPVHECKGIDDKTLGNGICLSPFFYPNLNTTDAHIFSIKLPNIGWSLRKV